MFEIIKLLIELLGYGISAVRLVFDILKWRKDSKITRKKRPQSHHKKRRQKHKKKRREKAPRVAARKRA